MVSSNGGSRASSLETEVRTLSPAPTPLEVLLGEYDDLDEDDVAILADARRQWFDPLDDNDELVAIILGHRDARPGLRLALVLLFALAAALLLLILWLATVYLAAT